MSWCQKNLSLDSLGCAIYVFCESLHRPFCKLWLLLQISVCYVLPGCPQGHFLPQVGLWAGYVALAVPGFFTEQVGTVRVATPWGPGITELIYVMHVTVPGTQWVQWKCEPSL